MYGMSLSTTVKDTVSRVACDVDVAVDVAVAVAVAVSRVRVHRLAAISASGRERASVPSLSVSPRVSPALAAAEGRQSTRSILPSRPRLVATSSLDECKPGQNLGGQWPMCARPASRLLWCARLSERGVVQHWGSKSWQWHVRASACPVVLVLIQVWQWQQWQWHLHLCLHIHHQMYMHVHMYLRK